jgi:hypothetical protein
MELKDRIVDLVNTRLLESYDKVKEWDRSTANRGLGDKWFRSTIYQPF